MIVGSTTNNSSWKNRAESLDELATKKVEDNFISSDYNDSFDSEDQESKMEESFRELNNKESPVTQIDLFDESIEESIGI